MTPIFITSFFRKEMTQKTLELIHERTNPGTYSLHVYDNASDPDQQDFLYRLFREGLLTSLHMDSRNTGCLYNKAIFHVMAPSDEPYYVVSDNDIYPPKLDPDWLSQMISIMNSHPELAFLGAQIPPVSLMMPTEIKDDIIYCKAVGNALKLVRRQAFPIDKYAQQLNTYGDDGLISRIVNECGWRTAFCRNIFCYHAGQCKNWGYRPEEINKDPRKQGYGEPYITPIENWDTFMPMPGYRM